MNTFTYSPVFLGLFSQMAAAKGFDPLTLLQDSQSNLSPSLIYDPLEAAEEHDATPIKNVSDINSLISYFLSKGQYRNMMLLVLGINFGLRFSDLSNIRFKDVIDPQTKQFREKLVLVERKTANTRKHTTNRHVYINKAAKLAIQIYLSNTNGKSYDDYLFVSESKNAPTIDFEDPNGNTVTIQKPMTRRAAEDVIKKAAYKLNIEGRFGTHCFRKTFGYHVLANANNVDGLEKHYNSVELLQKIFGHSKADITLRYAGYTNDVIKSVYLNHNLGFEVLSQYVSAKLNQIKK